MYFQFRHTYIEKQLCIQFTKSFFSRAYA